MASVRQLPTSNSEGKRPWVVTYTDRQGKRRQATPKSGLKRDAEKLRLKIENELATGFHVAISQSVKISEAMDLWLEHCRARVDAKDNLRPLTLKNWRNISNKHVRPHLGHIVVSELTVRDVQSWVEALAYRKDKPVGRPSIVHALHTLRYVLKFCEVKGLTSRNILVRGEIRIPGRLSKPILIPSKDEVRDLLAGTKESIGHGGMAPYLSPIVHIAVYSGLRIGEIRALAWEHVDLDRAVIKVRNGMDPFGNVDDPKTLAGIRDVPIPPKLLTELKAWSMRCGRPASGLLFTGRTGVWLKESAVSMSWRRLLNRVLRGKRETRLPPKSYYHFHALRHVYASLLIESGLPPKRIQYLMGHASIKITFDRYGHLFDDPALVQSAMEKFGSGLVSQV